MEIELSVHYEAGRAYIATFRGDKDIIESILTIYTKRLLSDGIGYKLSFARGDD